MTFKKISLFDHNAVDLKTMAKRVESEQYYVTFEMFVADVRRMFGNARTYNAPETIYYKCATRYDYLMLALCLCTSCWLTQVICRLEAHFQSRLQSGLQSANKVQP